jgi:hypothetical protein
MATLTFEVPDEFAGMEPDPSAVRQLLDETIEPGHQWTELGVLGIVAQHLRKWERELPRDSEWVYAFNRIAEQMDGCVQRQQDEFEALLVAVKRDNAEEAMVTCTRHSSQRPRLRVIAGGEA